MNKLILPELQLVIDGYMGWEFWKLFQEPGEITNTIYNEDKSRKVVFSTGGGEKIPQRIDLISKEEGVIYSQAYMAREHLKTLNLVPIDDPVDVEDFVKHNKIYKPCGLIGIILHGFYKWNENVLLHNFYLHSKGSSTSSYIGVVKTYFTQEQDKGNRTFIYMKNLKDNYVVTPKVDTL